MYKIILIEDDRDIAEVVKDYFERRKESEVTIASDGRIGEAMLYEGQYDLVLLDVMMPGLDGYTVCSDIRANSDIPIIFLTARGQQDDVLRGYSLGCDDYVQKPYSIELLYAKSMALLKRSKGLMRDQFMECGHIRLNPVTLDVFVKEEKINLPQKELMILRLLMEYKNSNVSRETILVKVWGYDYEGSERVVDNRVKNLRKLLGFEGKNIKTVFKRGYQLQD
ncbi:MAG: response regulator transcription factor [Eubacterium sp.]|jgi:DNA-binding response OmpR family regulator|nr:response regulator transcription factor [Eubacterium sp.]MEE3398836.1 response regulator transcription factor [Eubacterium sp.]